MAHSRLRSTLRDVLTVLRPALAQGPPSEALLRVARALMIGLGVALPVAALLPEVLHLTPDLNDGAFHLGVTRNVLAALHEHRDPLDFWFPTWTSGFPLFHYYQPGPYLLLALLHLATFQALPLLGLMRVVTVAAVALFPLALWRAMKSMGLGPDAAAAGALLACTISAKGSFGIEIGSFAWGGWCLFGQAVALPLLPLAVAGGFQAVERRRRTAGYAALLAAAFLAHVLYGYIACLSLGILPFLTLRWPAVRARLVGLLRVLAQAGGFVAFFALPLVLHAAWHAKSLYDPAEKFDSHGAGKVITWLLGGTLFDDSRVPVLTVLLAFGALCCARRWLEQGSRAHGFVVVGFAAWLCLYFGRATWGRLADLLPMSSGLHMERLVSGVHLFGLLLAAVALGAALRWCAGLDSPGLRCVALLGLAGIVVAPIAVERTRNAQWNVGLVRAAESGWKRDAPLFAPILERLREDPGSRTYAGHSGNWGMSLKVGDVQAFHVLSAEALGEMGNAPFSWALPGDMGFQFDGDDARAYDLYDVQWLLCGPDVTPPAGATLAVSSGPYRLWRVAERAPFSLVSVPLALAGDKQSTWYMDLSWTKGSWHLERTHALLLLNGEAPPEGMKTLRMEGPFRFAPSLDGTSPDQSVFEAPGPFVSEHPPAPSGTITDAAFSRQEGSATVTVGEPAFVLAKVTYHPWWHAWVDGAPARTFAMTPGLLGVQVPAGTHQLRVAYEPGWLKLVLLLCGCALAFAIDAVPTPWSGPAADAGDGTEPAP